MALNGVSNKIRKLFHAEQKEADPTWLGLEGFFLPATISGQTISPSTALRVPAVAAAVAAISDPGVDTVVVEEEDAIASPILDNTLDYFQGQALVSEGVDE